MAKLTVAVVVGNPKAGSRTLAIAQEVVAQSLEPGDVELTTIDLADHAGSMFEWPSDTVDALSAAVAGSDVAVFASPTYKASYTGLLKAFLDRYGSGGLSGVVAVPVMTGADLQHSMAPDAHLRPLLVELGASVPTRSLYFVASEFDRRAELVADWAVTEAPGLRRAIGRG